MEDFDAIARIEELCRARGWTYYRLAKESDMTYSTLNTMLHKTSAPSIPSLIKICSGFGITLSQFFSNSDESVYLTGEQKELLQLWDKLDAPNRELTSVYMHALLDRQQIEIV